MENVNRTVIVFGTFDPMHQGHLNFFDQAKSLGNKLIVVVARDSRIRSEKNREPFQSEQERLNIIRKLQIVDNAILGDEIGDYSLIDKFNPDIVAIGYDQLIPEVLKERLKKCKIVTLKPHRSDVFKSTIIRNRLSESG